MSNQPFPTKAGTRLETVNATDATVSPHLVSSILARDGAVIVKSLVPASLCALIQRDLQPRFDSDAADASGFFPPTTKRAFGVLAYSDAAAELVLNPLFQSVARRMLNSRYSYWEGQERREVVGMPQVASIVGFRVEPGGKQQALHRDDADYHARNVDHPVMLGCVTVSLNVDQKMGVVH